MHYVLGGYPGSGKSTVGELLAVNWNIPIIEGDGFKQWLKSDAELIDVSSPLVLNLLKPALLINFNRPGLILHFNFSSILLDIRVEVAKDRFIERGKEGYSADDLAKRFDDLYDNRADYEGIDYDFIIEVGDRPALDIADEVADIVINEK